MAMIRGGVLFLMLFAMPAYADTPQELVIKLRTGSYWYGIALACKANTSGDNRNEWAYLMQRADEVGRTDVMQALLGEVNIDYLKLQMKLSMDQGVALGNESGCGDPEKQLFIEWLTTRVPL